MCFWCEPVEVSEHEDTRIVLTRVADTVTSPADLGLDAGLLASFESGQWLYVGLSATVLDNNVPVATTTLYGIPEGLSNECAYTDVAAVAWVLAEVLGQHQQTLADTA